MQKCNFSCRQALSSDNAESIAKYLHLTDPYIYPKICFSPTDKSWVELITSCMNTKNNLFSLQNLLVALCNEEIVGVLCVIPCGKKLIFDEGIAIPKDFKDKLAPVIEGYFKPLAEESFSFEGYNITNVCVDSNYRNNGIGSLLLSYCIDLYGSEAIHLDVIASNTPAISLYKRFGFEIVNEYFGYSGDDTELLCYHMVRIPSK